MRERQHSTDVSRRRLLATGAGTLGSAALLSSGVSATSTSETISVETFASQAFYDKHGWDYLEKLSDHTDDLQTVWPQTQINNTTVNGSDIQIDWQFNYRYKNPESEASDVYGRNTDFNEWLQNEINWDLLDAAVVLDWDEDDGNTGIAPGAVGTDNKTASVNAAACQGLPSYWSPLTVPKIMAHELGHLHDASHGDAELQGTDCKASLMLQDEDDVYVYPSCDGIEGVAQRFSDDNARTIKTFVRDDY